MWKYSKNGKKFRWGKAFVFIMFCVYSIAGLVLVFGPDPEVRIRALCALFGTIAVPFSIMVGGVAGTGIADRILKGKSEPAE